MTSLERALRDFLAEQPTGTPSALVGGVAVSARTEPRFTRDLDFAIGVRGDTEAEAYIRELRHRGYELAAALEQTAMERLSTARLRRGGRGPMIDLLFAACGIEPEIVADAEPIEIVPGVVAPVARVGHLIVMKLVSRDAATRPRDDEDLVRLAAAADADAWGCAEAGVHLVTARGFARGRDLARALSELRGLRA